jgi:hypothetical protein
MTEIQALNQITGAISSLVSGRVYRADQMKRNVDGNIDVPSESELPYFVVYWIVGTPQPTTQTFARATMRIDAAADDSNVALKLMDDLNTVSLQGLRLGNVFYKGYDSGRYIWTREIFNYY